MELLQTAIQTTMYIAVMSTAVWGLGMAYVAIKKIFDIASNRN